MKYLVISLSFLVLVGCSQDQPIITKKDNERMIYTFIFKGKPVDCFRTGHGLTCDWITYHKENK